MRAVDYLLIIYAMMNAIAFVAYGIDKHRARNNKWRIRERTLLIITWLMGGVGAWAGMHVFRHKTQHRAFRICAPLATVLQAGLMVCAIVKLV